MSMDNRVTPSTDPRLHPSLGSTPRWVAISSQKGGVGKTTTCLSLGASLAEQGQHVLLVDLDPQAHLTQALSVDPDGLRRTVGDALLYQASLLEVSRSSEWANLDLVPANRGLILVEKVLHTSHNYEFRLKTALQSLFTSPSPHSPDADPTLGASLPDTSSGPDCYYDWVIFDCPPSFGPLTINALAASDMVVIPVTCDYFSVQSLNTYLNLLAALRRNINPAITHRMLITLYDGRTRLSRLFYDQYRSKYAPQLFETVIPMDTRLRESSLFGRPITQYAAKARSAQEYRSLAKELIS
jgi:chromosome partitioning protein